MKKPEKNDIETPESRTAKYRNVTIVEETGIKRVFNCTGPCHRCGEMTYNNECTTDWCNQIAEKDKQIATLVEALNEIIESLDSYVDVDDGQPNIEMKVSIIAQQALNQVKGE